MDTPPWLCTPPGVRRNGMLPTCVRCRNALDTPTCKVCSGEQRKEQEEDRWLRSAVATIGPKLEQSPLSPMRRLSLTNSLSSSLASSLDGSLDGNWEPWDGSFRHKEPSDGAGSSPDHSSDRDGSVQNRFHRWVSPLFSTTRIGQRRPSLGLGDLALMTDEEAARILREHEHSTEHERPAVIPPAAPPFPPSEDGKQDVSLEEDPDPLARTCPRVSGASSSSEGEDVDPAHGVEEDGAASPERLVAGPSPEVSPKDASPRLPRAWLEADVQAHALRRSRRTAAEALTQAQRLSRAGDRAGAHT